MDVASLNLMALTDVEILQLRGDVEADIARRTVLSTAAEQAEALSEAWAEASGRKSGDPWAQPHGAHDAYRQGAEVTHNGKVWVSLVGANVWEPGISGWRELAPDDEDGAPAAPPEWVQPTGAHDAYKTGDLVTWQGRVYRSNRDGNVWSPSALPSGWDPVPTAPARVNARA